MAKQRNYAPVQKPKNTKGTIKRIIKYIGKQKLWFISMLISSFITSVLSVTIAMFIKPLVDDYLTPMIGKEFTFELVEPLLRMIGLIGVILLFAVLMLFVQSKCAVYLTQKTMNIIRKDLFESISALPISFFDTHTHGEIMSRFTNDVESLRLFINQGMTQLIGSVITIVGSFIIMIILSWQMTFFIVLMIFMIAMVTKALGKKSSKYFKAQQKELGEVNGYIEEIIEGQKVVKIFNHEDDVISHFDEINENLRKMSTSANTYASLLWPVINNISYVIYALSAACGGYLAVKNIMSVGAIITFLQYIRNFSQPIANLSQQFNNAISAIAGAERIFEIIDAKPEIDEGYVTLVNAKIVDGKITETKKHTGMWAWKHIHTDGSITYRQLQGGVEFQDVTFSYDGQKDVLHNVSLYAKPGQKIAFVGSTGAGKTTITNLINRFYEINNGKIRYDGINIQKIKKDDLRRSLSIVLQDTHLFTGTIEENIRYGNLDATHEDVVYAAKLANAHSFIEKLPHGYNTVLKGDGSNLSQGQRQLISIARAAAADAPVLILDEATSSIDTRTEKLIEEGMDKLMHGRTVFVIAHRLSTVRNANAIMVLENGKIIERGNHEELLSQNGKYSQLYTGSFEEER